MPAIEIRGLHKAFRIPHERRTTLVERALGLFRPVPYERFEALRGVDLEIEHGSFVGIIGNNGSGKSTLLKVIAGLLVPDAGAVRVDGTISALLELGLGFSPELTVRENVELYGAVLGYPRRQMSARIDSAIRFAELERFSAAKLKNLSTGMQMRLAFATALQAASTILLLDEILAVGDASFQHKCLEVFAELKERRRTVVLVSHNLPQVRQFCDRAVLIEAGHVAATGTPNDVIARYLEGDVQPDAPVPSVRPGGIGDGRIRLREGWMEDAAGNRLRTVATGERPVLVLLAEIADDSEDPVFGLVMRDTKGRFVYVVNTLWLGIRTGRFRAGQVVEVRIPFVATLRNGNYAVDAAAADHSGLVVHDWVHNAIDFAVTGSLCRDGAVDLRAEFSWRVVEPGVHEAAGQRAAGGGGLQ